MKILTVLGARPQFIKASPVSKALKQEGFEEILVHTGQHFDANMSQIFFDEMGIAKPHYNLNIHGLSHAAMTGKMLVEIEKILEDEKPNAVLVYGDTNSTLAGALAAAKLHLPVAHVEAGLRSFNQAMPEEINRIVTDRISKFLFCPTDTAVSHLKKEGFASLPEVFIEKTGDVMYDALIQFGKLAEESSSVIKKHQLSPENFVLCTIHRQENTDNPQRLEGILDALIEIGKSTMIVFPVHPRTLPLLSKIKNNPAFILIEPVGYLDMLSLLKNCKLVVTDSGGLQKEAFMSRKYCITCRDETEWVELVDAGVNKLCGSMPEQIISAYQYFSEISFSSTSEFYGKGKASQEI
ncbi:MAG: UDP-N-acetylglucosamine 2-epimerase (non-hydrolyzing), partial [Cyclobacteriaceae bacterium]|nr:UDP-N-acetylglucosamine 2-epimerase (non-hydrolyzing) [Cyclobacteriaceae bacterium]